MGAGITIKAHGDKIYATPSDDEERKTLITMYTRVNVSPKVVTNTYIFDRKDWHKIIKASMEV